ncbi:tetranectin-like protein isoform X2 [Thalassophryne amazonica]|uniref:tetranectin-like protein isoform X2 n=1 Tax=Thalassophryne amazonica TaxID=390379 RepID=UPI001471F70D|nr:tetranectin-like protein isoform X2 [Thalassophryne amazonica]
MKRSYPERQTDGQYILSRPTEVLVPVIAAQGVLLCPLTTDMVRLALPVFILLCLSLLHSSSSHPSRSTADDDDVKAQLERLWQEVNSLKEMQALQTVCLRGIKAHRKCYLTIEEPRHYHEANEDCIAQGGTLATPRDMTENNELRDYVKRSTPGSKDFWIGVADIVKEGQYVDVNSLPISFFNWDGSKRQPTGTKRESCVALSVGAQGKWHDEVCRSLKRYICEYVIP